MSPRNACISFPDTGCYFLTYNWSKIFVAVSMLLNISWVKKNSSTANKLSLVGIDIGDIANENSRLFWTLKYWHRVTKFVSLARQNRIVALGYRHFIFPYLRRHHKHLPPNQNHRQCQVDNVRHHQFHQHCVSAWRRLISLTIKRYQFSHWDCHPDEIFYC